MDQRELPQPAAAQLELLRSQLRLKPGDGQAWLALARMQSFSDPAGATDRYQRIITEFPGDSRAREQLAEVRLEQGDVCQQSAQWQKALDAYREVEDSRAQAARRGSGTDMLVYCVEQRKNNRANSRPSPMRLVTVS
jgi:uncharacterized membrane protein YccC